MKLCCGGARIRLCINKYTSTGQFTRSKLGLGITRNILPQHELVLMLMSLTSFEEIGKLSYGKVDWITCCAAAGKLCLGSPAQRFVVTVAEQVE